MVKMVFTYVVVTMYLILLIHIRMVTQVFRLVDIHQLRIRLIGQHIIQLRIVHLIIMQMLVMKMLMDLQLS